MIELRDNNLDEFFLQIEGKHLFMYGAGTRAQDIFKACDLKDSLIAVIDNNKNLQGSYFYRDDTRQIKIIDVKKFISYVELFGIGNVVLLITPSMYFSDIVDELNTHLELSGLICYFETLLVTFPKKQDFCFTQGPQKIPKKIHYCWFGKHKIPAHLQRYIDQWKEKCPDYEIIRWDENTYDISKNRYMREAYDAQKWGFVPDYARLDIVYQEGGIYLDTDVELLRNFDDCLADEAFFGFAAEFMVATGLGFGAVSGNLFVKELRDDYDDKRFYNPDGSLNLAPCTFYQNPIFKAHGFSLRSEYQNRGGIALYPAEIFCPTGKHGERCNFTEKTISIHHSEASWIPDKWRKALERTSKMLSADSSDL